MAITPVVILQNLWYFFWQLLLSLSRDLSQMAKQFMCFQLVLL